jgi:guanylate kinase
MRHLKKNFAVKETKYIFALPKRKDSLQRYLKGLGKALKKAEKN